MRRNEALPRRAGRLVRVVIERKRHAEVVVREHCANLAFEIRYVFVSRVQRRHIVELPFEVRFERTNVERGQRRGVEPAARKLLQRQCLHAELVLANEVEGVAEEQGICRGHLTCADVTRLSENVDVCVPVVQVEYLVERIAELLEVLGSRLCAGLLRLEVASAHDLIGVAQSSAFESEANGGADDVRGRHLDERVV